MLSQAGERAAELSLRSKGGHTPGMSRPPLGQETKAMPPVGPRKPSLTIQVWKPEGSAGERTRKKWTEEKEEKVSQSSRAQKRRQMAEAVAGAGSLRPADDGRRCRKCTREGSLLSFLASGPGRLKVQDCPPGRPLWPPRGRLLLRWSQ